MRNLTTGILITLLALLTWHQAADAEETKYTRFGAEAGGNATGDIPAFEGAKGLKCPENYQKGRKYLQEALRHFPGWRSFSRQSGRTAAC